MGNDQAALRGVKMPIKIENLPSIRGNYFLEPYLFLFKKQSKPS